MTQVPKALETFYHGYRFRSRLEARWAVFFDRLGISYTYEPEGYLIGGKKGYLPDFYLPQLDCYIEIKPKQPSAVEVEKTRLLAYSGRCVYILYGGDVWFAEQPLDRQACLYTPPKIYALLPQMDQSGEALREEVADFLEVKALLQRLDDVGLTVQVHGQTITFSSTARFDRQSFQSQRYLSVFQRHSRRLAELNAELQELHSALLEALTEQAGCKRVFVRQQMSWDFAWAECSACGDLALRNEQEEDGEGALVHDRCPRQKPGSYSYTSARLKAAYQAARQERFST